MAFHGSHGRSSIKVFTIHEVRIRGIVLTTDVFVHVQSCLPPKMVSHDVSSTVPPSSEHQMAMAWEKIPDWHNAKLPETEHTLPPLPITDDKRQNSRRNATRSTGPLIGAVEHWLQTSTFKGNVHSPVICVHSELSWPSPKRLGLSLCARSTTLGASLNNNNNNNNQVLQNEIKTHHTWPRSVQMANGVTCVVKQ